MNFSLHDQLLWFLGVLLRTGLPFLVLASAVIYVIVISNRTTAGATVRASTRLVFLICGLLWVTVFGEHYSPSRQPVFDYAAPIMSMVALLCLPVLLPMSLYSQGKGRPAAERRIVGALTGLLGLLSLVPGSYMVWFYVAKMMQ